MAAVFAKRLTRLILVSISQNEPFIFGLLSDEASIPQNEEFRVRSPCIEEFALSSGRICDCETDFATIIPMLFYVFVR